MYMCESIECIKVIASKLACSTHVIMLLDTGGETIPMLYNLRSSTAATTGLHVFTHDNQTAGANSLVSNVKLLASLRKLYYTQCVCVMCSDLVMQTCWDMYLIAWTLRSCMIRQEPV